MTPPTPRSRSRRRDPPPRGPTDRRRRRRVRHDFTVVDLPRIPAAASIVPRGSVNEIVSTGQTLAAWIEAGGHRAVGCAREVYLEYPPDAPDRWVTELRAPIIRP